MAKMRKINTYLKNTTQKSEDQATQNPPKTGHSFGCPGWVTTSCSLVAPIVLLRL